MKDVAHSGDSRILPPEAEATFFLLCNVLDHRFELRRERRVELDAPAVARVREGEPARVQERPFEPHHRAQVVPDAAVHAAVGLVADNRVADGAEMHTDLMGTARWRSPP